MFRYADTAQATNPTGQRIRPGAGLDAVWIVSATPIPSRSGPQRMNGVRYACLKPIELSQLLG